MTQAIPLSEQFDSAPFESFEWLRTKEIPSLKVLVSEYRHKKTQAMHYHIAADNPENVFLVALRTVPEDSAGVAHILEHTALCGSEKYPVRDPFFMMIRRSLNTFMNAFTSSDWTAYPFASQNRKDFNNLLDVYLDAVFFSRLDELDFRQEGHRVEFENPTDPSSNLVFKGVVFNEMKGAMSSPVSTVYDVLNRHLFPSTTYHFNSGGDPENIPDLRYEELKSFYKSHYHPSNAVFMTYGDMPVKALQEKFEQKALQRFDFLEEKIFVGDEKRYQQPLNVEEVYALDIVGDDETALKDKTHFVLAWLLGYSTDLEEHLKMQLLSDVLLGNSASPLQQALENTELGIPSSLCGLETSNREMSFMCGLEGSNPEQAQAYEDLVMSVLEDIVKNGVNQQFVESALHQLELSQREIGGGGYPYGLQLILTGLPSAMHRGDPIALLDLDPVLERLRVEIKDPGFIPRLVNEKLLQNKHRVRLSMKPDSELNLRKKVAEEKRLQAMKAAMSEQEKVEVVDLAKRLSERQMQKDDESVLPKVGLEDVPEDIHIPEGLTETLFNTPYRFPVTTYEQGTNGIVYQQIIIELPDLDDELLGVLPYYTRCLTEVGSAGRDYLETQAKQASVTGGLHAYTSIRSLPDDEQKTKSYLVISSKALVANHYAMSQLMKETLEDVKFHEHIRIAEMLAQQRAHAEQSVTGSGHSLAMQAAASGMAPTAELSYRLNGLEGIKALKALDEGLKASGQGKQNLVALADKFALIHQKILTQPRQWLLIAEPEKLSQFKNDLKKVWQESTYQASSTQLTLQLGTIRETRKQLWVTSTQVNFCAKAYPTVTVDHEDAAPLTVLGGFLRNGYLHRAIREQGGAYGSGASQDSSIAAFRFFSYRDPRLVSTLEDFDKSIVWLLNESHSAAQLEEAILGVIGDIDKPSSPSGEAKQAFHNTLFGRTAEQRKAFRARILQVTLSDLLRVGERYLNPENASVAVITNGDTQQQLGDLALGMTVFQL